MTEWLLDGTLGAGLLLLAGAVLYAPTLYMSVVLFIGFGLLVALTWARLGAPDLALAEAAIGAGLIGVLLLATLSHAQREHIYRPKLSRALPAALLTLLTLALLWRAVWPLDQAPVLLPSLVEAHLAASGVDHPVTAVLLNFRAWDTLLELMVILFALLGARQLQLAPRHTAQPWPLLLIWGQWLAPLALLLGTYILWRGAAAPGGAFQAGALWAAGAIILRLNGLLPPLHWRHWVLRLMVLAGLTVFLAVAVLTGWLGEGWLAYPSAWAKALILLIEILATLSIATILTLLVVADQEEFA